MSFIPTPRRRPRFHARRVFYRRRDFARALSLSLSSLLSLRTLHTRFARFSGYLTARHHRARARVLLAAAAAG